MAARGKSFFRQKTITHDEILLDLLPGKDWGLSSHIKEAGPVFGTPARLLNLHQTR
jgi:hypothetical protein